MTLILNWIKANLIIVILCAAMVICLPTFYVLGEMMNKNLRSDIQKRADNQLSTLKGVEYATVEIDPLLPGAESVSEKVTLTDAVILEYERVRNQIKSDSEAIVAEALAVNQKPVMSDRIFPKPRDTEAHLPFELHGMYLAAHDQLIRSANAGMPMLPEDVSFQLSEYRDTYLRTQLNVEPGMQLKPSEEDQLEEAMTRRRMSLYSQTATEFAVYADSTVFVLADWKMETGRPPNERERFDWQHQLWVHTDLIDSISRANEIPGGGGELATIVGQPSSVVKRILSITLQPLAFGVKSGGSSGESEMMMGEGDPAWGGEYGFSEGGPVTGGKGGGSSSRRGGGTRRPEKPTPASKPKSDNTDPTKPLDRDYAQAISGRTTNGLYDVRRADVVLIVDSARFDRLIDAINSTNFMTVTNIEILRIEPREHLAQGFFYGNEPVVEAALEIETLWFRDWTTQWMSDDVKEWLGIPVESDDASGDGG
ncbi:MAG: hypothetical protein D8M59_15000 [Planctomycetes bacterium]|nr:hypothetical protein [Planctomycetota bacterium]NOG54997.1 hypothetical protein [Planctomycetota bacterium]